jgi:single-strand DNA-binding protein
VIPPEGPQIVMRVIAESLGKGTRVIVTGRLRQRSYEAQDGGKRTVHETLVF